MGSPDSKQIDGLGWIPVRNQQGGNRGNADAARLELLETVRGLAAVKLGLNDDYKKSAWETPGISKMTFVAEPGCLRDSGWNDNPERRNRFAFAYDVDAEIASELCDDRSHVHGGSSCAGKRSCAGVKSQRCRKRLFSAPVSQHPAFQLFIVAFWLRFLFTEELI